MRRIWRNCQLSALRAAGCCFVSMGESGLEHGLRQWVAATVMLYTCAGCLLIICGARADRECRHCMRAMCSGTRSYVTLCSPWRVV